MLGVSVGSTDISIDVLIVDDTGLPVTGLVAATFPTVKYSRGTGADATISLSDLSALTDAHSDGGVKERGEGVYRLDLPDAVASTVAVVKIRGEASGKRLICEGVSTNPVPSQLTTRTVSGDSSVVAAAGADGDTLKTLSDQLDTVGGYLDTEVAAILAAVDTEVAAILADTNELQQDWADGGRLDVILDARASQTSVDGVPTNAEMADLLHELATQMVFVASGGSSGTTPGVDGIPSNPADSFATAKTIAAAMGVRRIFLIGDLNETLAEALAGYHVESDGAAAVLFNSQTVDRCTFHNLTISGVATAAGDGQNGFETCAFGTCTLPAASHADNCTLGSGTITLPAGATELHNCIGQGGTIAFATGNQTLRLHLNGGTVTFTNLGANGTDVLELSGHGTVTFAASCTGGTVRMQGQFDVTDSSSGVTFVDDELKDVADAILGYVDTEVAAILAAVDTEVAAILADTGELQTDWVDGGRLDLLVDAIKAVTDALGATAAGRLKLSAETMVTGTVDNTGFSPTTTEFEADDITEATADHFNGRIVIFTSGALQYQASDITDYSLASGRGHLTVTALTEAPANDVTFIIV